MCLKKIRPWGSLPLCPFNRTIVLGSSSSTYRQSSQMGGMGEGRGSVPGVSFFGEIFKQEVGGDSSSICAAVALVGTYCPLVVIVASRVHTCV